MSRKVAFVLLLIVAFAPFVHGQDGAFSIDPAQPRFQESVHLHVNQQSDLYVGAQVSMAANTITVSLQPSGFTLPPAGSPFDVPLGQFPAGAYDVNVVLSGSGTALSTLHFQVGDAPASQGAPLGNFSDLWWNPSESGWGITIIEHPSTIIFAAWFVYGSDGKPIWYVLPGGSWKAGIFSGDLYRTTGPYFGGTFNPAAVSATRAGTASLAFTDLSHGTLSYTVDGVTATKSIQREAF